MFSQHPKCKFWSKRNEKNPSELCLNSHKKFWFDCDKCSHEFECILKNINNGRWCPYCSNKKLCDKDKNCNICFEKSFASLEKSKQWSNKNELSPNEFFKNSCKKFWFDCECGHTFETALKYISFDNCWCPYCANRLLCKENLNCELCITKTFASINRSSCWSSKNILKPNQVFKSTASKFWFDCDKCNNEFESKLCHITDGSWCPKCRYKTEDILNKILSKKYNSLKSQFKVDWCKNIKHLPFDFVIEERKIIIEQDGEQHWKQVAKWKTPEHNRKRDLYKMKCANDNGFSIIRIIQEDILHNKYNWLDELISNIEKITNENRVQNIYMCKNNEYKDFDM